jgi:ubiquinone/menaquinone biosynthesis C-methylase UbiE
LRAHLEVHRALDHQTIAQTSGVRSALDTRRGRGRKAVLSEYLGGRRRRLDQQGHLTIRRRCILGSHGHVCRERTIQDMNTLIPEWLASILRDPETGESLERRDNAFVRSDGKPYRIKNGILSIVYPDALTGADEHWNRFYDKFAPFYEFTQRVLGKLLTGVDTTTAKRDVIDRLRLPRSSRVLEVSPGPGVFQSLLREQIGAEGELVALDLSQSMLRQCQRRGDSRAYLIHGNGQYLPFSDDSFDALFHFGGVNLFNDPGKAIGEFVRVVKKGGIVSWGDEGFSPSYPHPTRKKVLTFLNLGYLRTRPNVPKTIVEVETHEVFGGLAYLIVGRKQ